MSNPLISQLTKTQILSLPGFQNKSKKTKLELKNELNRNISRMRLVKKGLRLNDYINAIKNTDDNFEKEILNISTDLYSTAKTEARQEYKKRIKDVSNKKRIHAKNVKRRYHLMLILVIMKIRD